MKRKFDLVSLVVGLGLGVALMLATGAASGVNGVGRYQLGGTASHGLVLDTTTGQVWTAFLSGGKADADFFTPKGGR